MDGVCLLEQYNDPFLPFAFTVCTDCVNYIWVMRVIVVVLDWVRDAACSLIVLMDVEVMFMLHI